MTIHLPKDIESSIVAAVHSGHFASAEDALAAAWRAFEQRRHAMPKAAQIPKQRTKANKAAKPSNPLTEAEVLQQMLADGVISRLPDRDADFDDDDDEPVVIEGEPLSETIIRERR